MRVAVLALIGAALVFAGCGTTTKTVTTTKTRTVTVTRTTTVQSSPAAATQLGAQNTSYFGQIVSITAVDAKRYLLVLKPEQFLVGVTAGVAFAAQQGTQCQPLLCPGPPDDHLVLPAGTKQLTFVLPATTRGTVLTVGGGNFQTTNVSAAQLAALVGGAKTPKLIEPLVSGVWLAVDVDKVTSFAQQFQP
ncbi:MAG TPA: hypothetical protein VKB70_06820 [Gaiellaceae bacterium]|nr:hypothetical protein [Gaiellaceae bacterium]